MVTLPTINVAGSTTGNGKSAQTGVRNPAKNPQQVDTGYSDKGKKARKQPEVQKVKHVEVISRNARHGEIDTYKLRLHVPKDKQQDHNGGTVDAAVMYMTADGPTYEYNGKTFRLVSVNSEGVTQAKNNANKLSDDTKEDPPSAGNTPLSGRSTNSSTGLDMNAAAASIRRIESGSYAGNYSAQNPKSSASGAYQFIDGTWKSASAAAGYGGQYATAASAPPAVQDAVFKNYFSGLVSKYGANGAVNAYFTGNPNGNLSAEGKADNAINASQYQDKFWNGYNNNGGTGGADSAAGGEQTSDQNRQTCLPTENSNNNNNGSTGSGQGSGGDGTTPSSGGGSASKDGLNVKSNEVFAGGESKPGVYALAHNVQDNVGDFNRFTAFNDSYHQGTTSLHAQGLAFDFTVNNPASSYAAAQQVRNIMSANGISGTVINEYSTPSARSTGGHIHVQINSASSAQTAYSAFTGGTPQSMSINSDMSLDLILASVDVNNLTSLDNIDNTSALYSEMPFGEFGITAEIPLPPSRPGNLTGSVSTPLPPSRPADLASSAPTTPSNLANNGKTDSSGGNAPPIPPSSHDVSELMQGFDKGGILEQVQKLTKLTGDLNQITTTIAQLLPGAPYSFIGIAATLVKNLGTIQNGLGGILGQMDPSVQSILQNIQSLPNMSAMTGQIEQIMSGLGLDQFMKLLPPNLSVDKLMTSLAGMDPTMLSGIANGMSGSNNQGAFNQLQQLMDSVSSNTPANTTQPTPTPTYSVTPLPPTRPSDLNIINNVPLPPSRPADLGTTSVTEFTTTEYSAESETVTVPNEYGTREILQNILARDITTDQWNILLWASTINAGDSAQEIAWFVKTILNRCRKTGKNIGDILKDFGDFENLRPIDSYKSSEICKSITDYIATVPDNNYYFDKLSEDEISTGTILKKKRGRVLGIQIGKNVVYPGAKWP